MVPVVGLLGQVLVPAAGVDILALLQARSLRILLQVGNIVRCVSALEDSVGSRRLLLSLPKKVASKRLGKLSGEHVAAGGSGRESSLGMHVVGSSNDGLSAGSRNLVDGLQRCLASALHHERAIVRVVGGGSQARSNEGGSCS